MFTYEQKTGVLSHNGEKIGTGYSGHGTGYDNPDAQSQAGIGPIPKGRWKIGTFFDHPHLGPDVSHLTAEPGTETFGRSAFFIHGDNADLNHSASDGCIVLDRASRDRIRDSGDTELEVI